MTDLFIRRPVMTTLVMIGILFFGLIAYRRLPVNDLPTVDYPTISVSASLAGASPETMAATVATPLEKSFSAVAGIDNMTSVSTQGSTQITIQFSLDRNSDAAAQDVQAAIAQTLVNLPSGIIPPSYNKVNPAAAPILFLALTSPTLALSELDEIGETTIAQRLSMVSGVAQVAVYGAQKYAVRVQLDPAQLAARGLGVEQVAQAINNDNANLPTGILWGPNRTLTVNATGQLSNAAEFRNLTVAYHNGARVRLGDVALVLDDVQNNKAAAWYNGSRSIVLAVQRQPGTNTVAVATAVKDELKRLTAAIPPGAQLHILYDRSRSIEQSVNDVKLSLTLALCLVVLVIFLFLRTAVATFIPSVALPMSIIGTFSVMYLLGYSLDNLSLMALTLAVGFVVDDAIVMLENIVRHMEMGLPPMQAAFEGAREVGFTILSMTLSLAAVFIPLIFMGGLVGRLFHEFAVTIMVTVLVSGFVSLTLTPMLCSRFLAPPNRLAEGERPRLFDRIYDRSLGAYERSLGWVMEHRPIALAFSAAILVLTVALFRVIPQGLFPSDDTGQLSGTTEAAEGASFDEMVRLQQRVAEIVAKDKNVDQFMSAVGSGGATSSTNQGRLQITLKPFSQRPRADAVARELGRKLASVPGMSVFLQAPPSIRIGGRISKALYQFTLQSSDIDALYSNAQKLTTQLRKLPDLTDVTSDLQARSPRVTVHIDRDQAGALGITPALIEATLSDAYGARQVSTIYTPANEYWVVMEVLPDQQRDTTALRQIYLRASSGKMIPLSALTKLEKGVGPLSVNHSGQLPSVTISFNTKAGVALGTAVSEVQKVARQTLPSTISTNFAGTAQAFQDSQRGMSVLLLVTVFVIYIILGVLYESFIHPITILSGLPFAAFGALLALLVCRLELDVYGFVGIVMLIGIVKKNAIMMIDFAIAAERSEHTTPERAIVEAARIRFRPIMMTTVAALLGTLPIAVGWGIGAATRRPLGVAVVGGLAFSQIVTLYVTPVFYTYLDELQGWLGVKLSRGARAAAAPTPTPVAFQSPHT